MLGFGVPLAVLLGVESVAALLLLGPVSVAYPVILLARTSKTSVGTTVVGAHVLASNLDSVQHRAVAPATLNDSGWLPDNTAPSAHACVRRHDLRIPQLPAAIAAVRPDAPPAMDGRQPARRIQPRVRV